MNVVTAAALAKMPAAERGNATIARTREFFAFRPDAPAWLLVDHDLKGMPTHVAGRINAAGGLWQARSALRRVWCVPRGWSVQHERRAVAV